MCVCVVLCVSKSLTRNKESKETSSSFFAFLAIHSFFLFGGKDAGKKRGGKLNLFSLSNINQQHTHE